MVNLKSLSISNAFIPESLVEIRDAPLRYLAFKNVAFSESSILSAASIIQYCRSLVDISFCNSHSNEPQDMTPLFDAVLLNTSIRDFRWTGNDAEVSSNEFRAFLNLVRETKTLHFLSFKRFRLQGLDLCQLLDALSQNESMELTSICVALSSIADISDDRKTVKRELNKAALRIITSNRTMTSFSLECGSHASLFKDSFFRRAFERNALQWSFQISAKEDEESSVYLNDEDGLDEKFEKLNADAASIVKIGRVLLGNKRKTGRDLPLELIDAILKEIPGKSIWCDQNWRSIRRAVLDGRTIGTLSSDHERYDAYELMYRCRAAISKLPQ